MTLPCDNHPDQLAVFLATDLSNGNTLTLCEPCFLDFCAMILGLSREPEPEPTGDVAGAMEVADLEPEPPAPDAELKSEPEPATPPAEAAEHRAEAAQEATTPGE